MAYFGCINKSVSPPTPPEPPTPPGPEYLYKWDFTKSLVDEVQGQTATLLGWNSSAISQNGVNFNSYGQRIFLGKIDMIGKSIEIDISNLDFIGYTSYHQRLIMNTSKDKTYGTGGLIYRKDNGWAVYGFSTNTGSNRQWSSIYQNAGGRSAFNNCTLKLSYLADSTIILYKDNIEISRVNGVWLNSPESYESIRNCDYLYIGGIGDSYSEGNQCYNMTIRSIRIYENEEEE